MTSRLANKNDIPELVNLYLQCFGDYQLYANFEINYIVNQQAGYVLEDEDGSIVSFFGCTKKEATNKDKLGLISHVMTRPDKRGHKYAINFLKQQLENGLNNQFDVILIQTKNWAIYKDLDLVDSAIKYVCQRKEDIDINNQPLIYEPDISLIAKIDSSNLNGVVGLIETNAYIEDYIKLYKELQMSFIANEGAYVWYSGNHISSFNYTNLASLYQLLNKIDYSNTITLFDDRDLDKYFDRIQPVVMTKMFKKDDVESKTYKLRDHML